MLIPIIGAPGKTTVQPPREGHVANIQRKPNPFSPDSEPDWVPASDLARKGTVDRKPAPPPRNGAISNGLKSPAPSGERPRTGKAPPPPVPRKPLSLSSQSSTPKSTSGSQAQLGSSQLGSARSQSSRSTGRSGADAPDLLADPMSEQIEWKALLPQ